MNALFDPFEKAKAVGRGILAVVIIGAMVVGLIAAIGWASDPLGLGKRRLQNAEAVQITNGQQAASNAAGAAINDTRATNVAKIDKTAQEARNAVHDAEDHDAALRGYLDGLDRLRIAGAAPLTDPDADGRRSGQDTGS